MFPDAVLLAPLTKGGNLPFRRLCADFGARVTCSEMVYAHKLAKGSRRELALLRHHPDEKFFGVQLAASKPEPAVEAAQIAVEKGARYIDLNCGCPIADTVKRGMGARLLQKVRQLEKILQALVEAVPVPVTVKLRTGFKSDRPNYRETARVAVDAGVAAVTLHGRSREQRYSRAADWRAVAELRELLPVPVYGNGDVLTYYEARDRLQQSQANGWMLARGALIKPWLFQEIAEQRELNLDAQQRLEIYHRLAGYFKEHFGDDDFGRRRALPFLSWHFSFLSRYRPYPEDEYLEASRSHPLLQTRDESGPPEDSLEALLACPDAEVHQQLAECLWDHATLDEVFSKVRQVTENTIRNS